MEALSITPTILINKLLGKEQKITIYDRYGNSFSGSLSHYCAKSGAVVIEGSGNVVSFHNQDDISSIALHATLDQLDWLTGKAVSKISAPAGSDFDLDDYIYQAEKMLAAHFSLSIKVEVEQVCKAELGAKLACRRVLEDVLEVLTKIAADSLGLELLGSVSRLRLIPDNDNSLQVRRSASCINISFSAADLPGKNLKQELERGIERIL